MYSGSWCRSSSLKVILHEIFLRRQLYTEAYYIRLCDLLLTLFVDILEVSCGQDAIVAKLQKKVAVSAGFTIDDLHFNEADCFFDEDDGDYYIKRIEPFGSCGTKIEVKE